MPTSPIMDSIANAWLAGFMQRYFNHLPHPHQQCQTTKLNSYKNISQDYLDIDGVAFQLLPLGHTHIKMYCYYGYVHQLMPQQSMDVFQTLLRRNFYLKHYDAGNRPVFSINAEDAILLEDMLAIETLSYAHVYDFLHQIAAHAKLWQTQTLTQQYRPNALLGQRLN